ncbi:spore gernimation protein [Lysinibacillus contaminans]|uniref:Spore gernimation protein n=1 Tax=Lysinibacillus contaminans TaxID=1293441 RepID=A0ABR5K0R6_9BACI|nr:Ger(x)C family spore germination protein [Lysinibacillus contaminans]KOS68497.1 spore gernimation protein [Lysinibacillus contaminans]
MKKITTVILLTLLTFLLSGCWSKRELNELAIAVALGVDKTDDNYEVSVQIVDPGQISSKQPASGRAPVITYTAQGKTVFEAIRKITNSSPRKPYFSHLQVVVIGEKLASEGIEPTIDFLARDHEIRNDFNIIVANKTTAKEVLNVLTPIEKIPAQKISSSIQNSEKAWGSTLTVNIDDLITTLRSNENSPVLTAIEVIGDPKLGIDQTNVERIKTPVILEFSGLAVFKQDKFVGVLTDDESKSYNFLNDNVESTIEVISCPKEGRLSTEITKSKTKIKGKIVNGIPKLTVHIEIDQNVGEVDCTINLAEKETIQMINEKTSNLIKEKTEQVLNTIQKNYQVDNLGFSEVLHRADPKEWKKIKEDWATIFPELEVNVKVNVRTLGVGTIHNSISQQSKE